MYSANVGRIARHIQIRYPDLTIIDVGANVGDTIAMIRSEVRCPILCIEGDFRFFKILQENAKQFDDVEIINTFLGDRTESVGVTVSQGGTAHLEKTLSGDGHSLVRLDSLLTEANRFWQSKMIKIDTDGYDNKILRGAEHQLADVRPVLFFEYDPYFLAKQDESPLATFSQLHLLGYDRILVYDNFGELFCETTVSSQRQLEALTLYFSGWKGQRYCDICVFHREDDKLFEKIADAEIAVMRAYKNRCNLQ